MSKTSTHLAVALLTLVIPSIARPQEKLDTRRTISVTGQGEIKASPDLVEVSFAVETTAARAGDAAAENAKRSAAVSAAIKAMLDAKDTITTSRYALEPRYENPKPGEAREPRISGYVARNEVQVEGHKVDAVGGLIDAAIGAGANRISGLQFALSQRGEAQRAALEKAGADARSQAEAVAKGLGVQLKGVVSASSSSAPVPIPRFGRAMAAAEARMPTSIEPGEVNVTATLQVTYEIE